jgi:hypothetical protein
MNEVKKNLILHVFPLLGREENWHWHISVIKKYRDLFDGKVVVSCVFGEGLSYPGDVEKMMPREVDFRAFKNDRKLGEMVTFYDQVESVIQEDGWTLRAHTKGVTHRQTDIETIWARAMWVSCIKTPPNSKKNCHLMGPMRMAVFWHACLASRLVLRGDILLVQKRSRTFKGLEASFQRQVVHRMVARGRVRIRGVGVPVL